MISLQSTSVEGGLAHAGAAGVGGRTAIRDLRATVAPEAAGAGWADNGGWCIRRALSADDLLDAYQFLCRRQEALGYPCPPASAVCPDRSGGVRDLATFVARSWPEIVGLAAVVVDPGEGGLPAERIFPEVRKVRQSGRLVSELTHRAMVPAYYVTEVPNDLLRCCAAQALFVGCGSLVIVLKPWELERFTSLGFERLSAVRSSGGPVPEAVLLAGLDLASLQEGRDPGGRPAAQGHGGLLQFYLRANPYRRYVPRWASRAEEAARIPA